MNKRQETSGRERFEKKRLEAYMHSEEKDVETTLADEVEGSRHFEETNGTAATTYDDGLSGDEETQAY